MDSMDQKEWEKYKKILNHYSPELKESASALLQEGKRGVLFQTTACVTAPILFSYVSWILMDAVARGKERLYFLARDGYVLYQIAEILCKRYRIAVECRYLYASRLAWRLPQYHLMGKQCMDKICLNGTCITLNKILDRGFLLKEEKEEIRMELKKSKKEMDQVLSRNEIENYKKILVQNTKFFSYINQHSRKAYQETIGYLRQEGLLEGKNFSIVDIGWVGSMQESLKCLLESMQIDTGRIDGYYFGMFRLPKKKKEEKNYHTWYFRPRGDGKRKILFSHNLFECMCCAEDGMTIGYAYHAESKQYRSILEREKNINKDWDISMQIDTICRFSEYAATRIRQIKKWVQVTDTKEMTDKLCYWFMVHPTKEQADYYGKFLFSDDITEKHMRELASVMSKEQIRQNSVWNYIKNRFFPNHFSQIEVSSYWMEGTLARSGCKRKWLKLWDVFLYKYLLFVIAK